MHGRNYIVQETRLCISAFKNVYDDDDDDDR